MPIYEYRCKDCECEFETIVQNAGEESSVRCPRCDGEKIERKLSCFSSSIGGGGALKSACSSPKGSGFS